MPWHMCDTECGSLWLEQSVCEDETGSMKDDTGEQIVAKSQMVLNAMLESLPGS